MARPTIRATAAFLALGVGAVLLTAAVSAVSPSREVTMVVVGSGIAIGGVAVGYVMARAALRPPDGDREER